jgi:hypothetical protein
MSAPAATAKRDGSATKKRKLEQQQQQQPTNDDDTWDILWPQKNGVLGNPGECTLLLQLDPDDAANLDTEGASGAIGRLEVDGDGGKFRYCFRCRLLGRQGLSRCHYSP